MIPLLPLVSKITEKLVHFQIKDCLNKKKLTYTFQSGCRPNHSADFCLAQLMVFVWTGISQVLKPVTDPCPSFRPILSAINTPSYKLKLTILLPLLTPLILNNYTIENSFRFHLRRKCLLLIVHTIWLVLTLSLYLLIFH